MYFCLPYLDVTSKYIPAHTIQNTLQTLTIQACGDRNQKVKYFLFCILYTSTYMLPHYLICEISLYLVLNASVNCALVYCYILF